MKFLRLSETQVVNLEHVAFLYVGRILNVQPCIYIYFTGQEETLRIADNAPEYALLREWMEKQEFIKDETPE